MDEQNKKASPKETLRNRKMELTDDDVEKIAGGGSTVKDKGQTKVKAIINPATTAAQGIDDA